MSGVWIANHDQIVFQRREGHGFADHALYVWNVRADTIRLLRRADEVLLDCELARDTLVCLHETPAQPRRLVTVSLMSGEISPIYDPNPRWSAFSITRVERLEADDAYGNQGFAHLVWPHDYQARRLSNGCRAISLARLSARRCWRRVSHPRACRARYLS